MVIAHRGASGYRPEHTLAAYDLAILQGADYVEPDLVITRDGVLVARHENALAVIDDDGNVREATTNVHALPQFAHRRTTKVVDGTRITGWFVEDFTAGELKTLRARERIPRLRPGNAAYDDRFGIPTLREIVDLARRRSRELGRTIGVYPELKHPGYFEGIGLPMEDALLATLHASYGNTATAPVFIQSFEASVLERLRPRTQLPLVQLIAPDGRPPDFIVSGDRRTYADLATPTGLSGIATYANGVGVHKSLIIPRRPDGTLGTPTRLVQDAHAVGLVVHAWTFRAENHFLPVEYRRGADPAAAGDAEGELCAHLRAGIDGFFTNHPDRGVAIIGCRCSHETRVLD
jgi:glycerophosphoryl diester phosphodiesterase